MTATLLPWVLFNLFIIVMLALDLFVFHRKSHEVTVKEASLWSIFWISLALIFNLYIYYARGTEDALNFFTGYLIEKSLSVDNLFVFLLIFKYFKTPSSVLHKVLFWGILGAIIMRAVFIWLGIALIANFHFVLYLFGAFLVLSGIKLGLEKDKEIHPERNPILKIFRYFFPVTKDYEGDHFFIFKQAKWFATPLLIVLITIETSDVIFAIDSIPAILAITYDPYIVYTSNIFAVLGLRSLYFVLQRSMDLFHYLHYGLAFILIFIGCKMLLADVYEVSNVVALGVVFVTLALSIAASLWETRTNKTKD